MYPIVDNSHRNFIVFFSHFLCRLVTKVCVSLQIDIGKNACGSHFKSWKIFMYILLTSHPTRKTITKCTNVIIKLKFIQIF